MKDWIEKQLHQAQAALTIATSSVKRRGGGLSGVLKLAVVGVGALIRVGPVGFYRIVRSRIQFRYEMDALASYVGPDVAAAYRKVEQAGWADFPEAKSQASGAPARQKRLPIWWGKARSRREAPVSLHRHTSERSGLVAQTPFISIIMPVYNACRSRVGYLRQALESIRAQTYHHFELIIVNDGSTDDTEKECLAFMAAHPGMSVRYFAKENGGQSSARNYGIERSEGEYIGFIDQDDIWVPNKLEWVVPELREGVDIVYTDADTIDENGKVVLENIHGAHGVGAPHPKTRVEHILDKDIFVMPGLMTVRKALLQQIGGFDEQLSGYEDDELFLRLFQAGTVHYLPVSTLKWRMYEENYSRSRRMILSRIRYYRKLMGTYAADGPGRATHGAPITARFFREFVTQAMLQRGNDRELSEENLACAKRLLPRLNALLELEAPDGSSGQPT